MSPWAQPPKIVAFTGAALSRAAELPVSAACPASRVCGMLFPL